MADLQLVFDDSLFVSGWDECDEVDAFLESDNESYNSLLEEHQSVLHQVHISMADTQAAIALHSWSVMSSAEKKVQIMDEMKKNKQNQIFHRLPSTLNLTL